MSVIITGGGTGGHVYPALAIAAALVERGTRRDQVHFVGAVRGMEARAVPEAGFAIDLLPGRGIRRSLRPQAIKENVAALWGTARAVVRARGIVRRLRPAIVVGVGGYASLPTLLAARLRFRPIPVVVHEQNAFPGVANRIAVGLGARAAISLPHTPLRRSTLTGNPVRAALLDVRRPPTATLRESGPLVVASFGGSLGARTLNNAMLELAQRWRHRADVELYHVTGEREHERCRAEHLRSRRADDRLAVTLVPYESNMEALYSSAAVVVARAGAVTVAELAIVGMPAVLVPLPGAPGDHQTGNARTLADAGAAVLLTDADCDGARLDDIVSALLAGSTHAADGPRGPAIPERPGLPGGPGTAGRSGDPTVEPLDAMSSAARRLARPEAAASVAELVESAGHLTSPERCSR